MILAALEFLYVVLGCWNLLDGHEMRGVFFVTLAIYVALRRALFERFKETSDER